MTTEDHPPPPRRRRKTHRISMGAVLRFADMLRERGMADDFAAAAVDAKAVITLSEDHAAFIRDFLDRHAAKPTTRGGLETMAVTRTRSDLIEPICPDPYDCPIR